MPFIPSFHFVDPADKLKPDWGMEVVNYCVYNSNHKSLISGKKVDQIKQFASGDFPMHPFMKIFRSMKKVLDLAKMNDGSLNENQINDNDTTGLSFTCLPLITTKVNSAISVVQKIPVEVTCTALDALAMKKKKEDIQFLKNKPIIESELQELADQMGVGKVDIGSTKHSSVNYSSNPMGLDLTQPDQEDIFSKLIYSLSVETAFEKALQQFYELKKAIQVRLLETKDQFYYGVSAHTAFRSSMTGLPDIEYDYPGDIEVPPSRLPDFSDNEYRIKNKSMTVMEMFNKFGNEICDEDSLSELINGDTTGYCACNGIGKVDEKNWGNNFRVHLKYIEVKSIDWVGVVEKKKSKMGVKFLTDNDNECTDKIWGQNTYGFYWLTNTQHILGMTRLDYSHRTRGQESYQNFSSNIYKSQDKSAVELSIGENKKAQMADIKLEHLIIKSLPPGKYIDLRFVRGALTGLKDQENKYTMQQLVNLAFEQNVIIGDTEGFDGKNDGQMKPFMDIIGGLKIEEARGYLMIIATASQNISKYTGINDQLTGEGANPEGLVGMQKLLINSSLNALYYCNEAMRMQYQCLFNIWASVLESSIREGGKTKQAIIDMIGIQDTNLIDGLDQSPLHNLTIKVDIGQREEERDNYNKKLLFLQQKGVISLADEYMLSGLSNIRERFAYLAVKENKFMKKQDEIRQEQAQQQQELAKQQGQNMVDSQNAKSEGDVKKVYAQGDVQTKVASLMNQLGLNKSQQDAIMKKALQQDRNQGQTDKGVKLIQAKADLEHQQPTV